LIVTKNGVPLFIATPLAMIRHRARHACEQTLRYSDFVFPCLERKLLDNPLSACAIFCRYFPKVESHTLLYFDSLHAIGFVDRQRITLNTSGPCRLAKPAEVGSLDGRARRLIANKDHGAFVCVPREMAGRLQGEAALGVAIGYQ
jgi:hypothetical protein